MLDKRPLGPWQGLARVVADRRQERPSLPHPSRTVLRAYLTGQLPLRPEFADEKRSEALRTGSAAWSASEVALHVRSCRFCRVRVVTMDRPPLHRVHQWAEAGKIWLSSPRRALVGWSLTVAQAAALITLLIWVTAPQPAAPIKPLQDHDEGQFVQMIGSNTVHSSLRVKFAEEVSIGELSEILKELGVVVQGPDEDGYYRVHFPNESAEDKFRALPIVQELRVEP